MVLITTQSQARSHLFCHCMRPRKTLSINAINIFIAITQMLFINYALRNFPFCFFLYTMIKVHDHSISWHCNEVFFANSHCLLAAISANKMIDNFNSALSPCVKEKMDFSFCQKIDLYIIPYSRHSHYVHILLRYQNMSYKKSITKFVMAWYDFTAVVIISILGSVFV